MDVKDAITGRKSVRMFKDNPVDISVLNDILCLAAKAPSGGNMQPWKLAVVQGGTKDRLRQACVDSIDAGKQPQPDIPYYPDEFIELYNIRRHYMGMSIYKAAGIDMMNYDEVMQLGKQNYDFFGSSTGIIFFLDNHVREASMLDLGMFMQNIMLLAQQYGLATCAQASWGNYSSLVKNILNVDNDWRVVCGMAIGYPVENAAVNHINSIRGPVDSFTTWHN